MDFLAPELSDDDEYRPTEASDIYSFAMTTLRLGTGQRPFEGLRRNANAANRMARNQQRPLKPPSLSSLWPVRSGNRRALESSYDHVGS